MKRFSILQPRLIWKCMHCRCWKSKHEPCRRANRWPKASRREVTWSQRTHRKTAKFVALCIVSLVFQAAGNIPNVISPTQSKEETTKSRCHLACSWKRALYTVCFKLDGPSTKWVSSFAGRAHGRKVNFRRQKQQRNDRTEWPCLKAPTASLALELLAREKGATAVTITTKI